MPIAHGEGNVHWHRWTLWALENRPGTIHTGEEGEMIPSLVESLGGGEGTIPGKTAVSLVLLGATVMES